MLPEKEPVPETGPKRLRTKEENQDSEQSERGNHENQESDETEEEKTEELDPNGQRKRKCENDEKEEENGNEEEEERRIRRAAGKGKQPMSKGALDSDYYDYDCDYHQNLAILRTMWNYKCKNGDFPHRPSLKLLDYIMHSLPYLKISREKLAKKIIALENNYNDAWELDEDNPGLDRPVDREMFNLSKRLWGNHKEFYNDWKWK